MRNEGGGQIGIRVAPRHQGKQQVKSGMDEVVQDKEGNQPGTLFLAPIGLWQALGLGISIGVGVMPYMRGLGVFGSSGILPPRLSDSDAAMPRSGKAPADSVSCRKNCRY